MEIFKYGLKEGLAHKIMEMPTFNLCVPWTFQQWKDAARDCHMKWLNQREFKDRSNKIKHSLQRALHIQSSQGNCNKGQRTTSQGGNAMDIDAMRGPDLSSEEKGRLIKANTCFYCTKPGHRARDCRKKARDCANQDNNTNNYETRSQTKAAAPDMNADNIANFLKDNVNTIDKDTKQTIIEKLLLQGFLQG